MCLSSPRRSSSERFGTVLVRVGDSERRVIEAKPDRTVQVYVQAGIVTRDCRVREL